MSEDHATAKRSSSTGRRRPSRSIRTKDQVIDAALVIVADGGVGSLTMQRVAARLGIGVMTLYTYVASKEDLLDALADRIHHDLFDTLTVPDSSTSWQDDLVDLFSELRRVLADQPGLAVLVLRSGRAYAASSSDRFLIAIEAVFVKMGHDDLAPATAAKVFSAAQQYVYGFALREAERQCSKGSGDDDARRWKQRLDELSAEALPVTRAATETFLSSASDEQFDFGLRSIIRGAALIGIAEQH